MPVAGPRTRTLGFADLDARTAYAVWRLRQDVFVVEQACAYPDLDGRDTEPATRHVLLEDAGDPPTLLGCARVVLEAGHAHLGRVVLAPQHRGRGLADLLLEAALAACGDRAVRLDAQTPLVGWYERHGFTAAGPEFSDDGIPHVPMHRPAPGTGKAPA